MLIRQILLKSKSLALPYDSGVQAAWKDHRELRRRPLSPRVFVPAILILLLGVWLTPPGLGRQESPAGGRTGSDPVQDCSMRLERLGVACLLFMRVNQGKMPASLSELYYAGYITELENYTCPGTSTELLSREEIDAKSGYLLSPSAGESRTGPLVQDRSPANHGGTGINVFYSDGSVRWEAAPAAGVPAESAGPASAGGGGGGGGPAAGISVSAPWPLMVLFALLLASAGLVAAILLRRRGPAGAGYKIGARIEVLYADGGSKVFEVRKGRTTIGRASDNSLVIHDPDVSSHHAEIVISEGSFILRDLGSTNGTFLNGERIAEAPVFLGDEIGLGSTRLSVRG